MDGGQEGARIGEILLNSVALLEQAGVDQSRIDAELLLGFCLSKTRTELYLSTKETIDDSQRAVFFRMIERRCNREPVAYIIGEREFWSRRFIVSPDVLIPRPETEFLVEEALRAGRESGRFKRSLDLCCGSGIIGIILALETGCRVVATDISVEALAVCRQNCVLHGVSDLVLPVLSDLATAVRYDQGFDLITANPPYISCDEIVSQLEPEVASFEPHLALDGGTDGFNLIRRIAGCFDFLLRPGGHFFMEIGYTQGAQAVEIISREDRGGSFASVTVLEDYAGRDRVIHVRKKE